MTKTIKIRFFKIIEKNIVKKRLSKETVEGNKEKEKPKFLKKSKIEKDGDDCGNIKHSRTKSIHEKINK